MVYWDTQYLFRACISSVYTRYVTLGNLLYASIIPSLQRDSLTSPQILQIPTPHDIPIFPTQNCFTPPLLSNFYKLTCTADEYLKHVNFNLYTVLFLRWLSAVLLNNILQQGVMGSG